MARSQVKLVEDITNKIFKALVKSIKYVLETDMDAVISDEYEDSYYGGDWPDSKYKNVKQQEWTLDWSDYYSADDSYSLDEDAIAEVESEIIQKYENKILPVVDIVKDEISNKFYSTAPSIASLVDNILDTIDITIENHPNFDPEEGICDGEVLLYLEAKFLN